MPNQLSREQSKALLRNKPIDVAGLTLYPVTMQDFEEWQELKSILTLRQGMLPGKYLAMPFLGALYALDIDTMTETGKAGGFIAAICRILALAMRLPTEGNAFHLATDANDRRKLTAIKIQTGDMLLSLTPVLFDRVRPVIAAQNGETLPDEADNMDLVEAEEVLSNGKGLDLEQNVEEMLYSVACHVRKTPAELMDWTIRDFMGTVRAIEREKMFLICGLAEQAAGAKYKQGNPYPSWMLNRKKGETKALVSMSTFMQGPGSMAVMK